MNSKLLFSALLIGVFIFQASAFAQDSTDTEKIKEGFNLGGVPAVAYDSDLGFLYGLVLNLYDYGDGSKYPQYDQSLYMEWSRTTKGSGKNILRYDNRILIPNTRMKLELNYLTEQAIDFYGFNGYNAYFNSNYLDKTKDDYISRLYYRHARQMLLAKADFEGKLFYQNLRWLAGISHYNISVNSVDINELNKGKNEEDILPDTASVYDKYVEWGVIPESEKNGGKTNLLKLGVVYDTRDIEASPGKGIWTEAIILTAPKFILNEHPYTKLSLTHRQYFTLLPKKLVLAYRLNYQNVISGDIPFYMMPFYIRSKDERDGIGGAKTLRGILRNRVIGDATALGNIELRYTFLRKVIGNQNISLTLSGFSDAARVLKKHKFSTDGVTDSYGKTRLENINEINYEEEKFHISYGAGLHIALNTNFIIAIDYGMANNPKDGEKGLYILFDYLF